jgi:hypothetical protein
MKKVLVVVALVASFAILFPVSVHIADPFFTHPFHKEWRHAVLLIWPDHVEARSFDHLSEVSPRAPNAGYTFNISPEARNMGERAGSEDAFAEWKRIVDSQRQATWRLTPTNQARTDGRWNFRVGLRG